MVRATIGSHCRVDDVVVAVDQGDCDAVEAKITGFKFTVAVLIFKDPVAHSHAWQNLVRRWVVEGDAWWVVRVHAAAVDRWNTAQGCLVLNVTGFGID